MSWFRRQVADPYAEALADIAARTQDARTSKEWQAELDRQAVENEKAHREWSEHVIRQRARAPRPACRCGCRCHG